MSGDVEPKRRLGFVEMLFALTAAEIAVRAADLVKDLPFNIDVLPAYTHLLVATILVTTSWVGWLMSKAPGNLRDVTAVFSWGFVVLLLDVFLVVCYFIIVRGVEVERVADRITTVKPSTDVETRWLMLVFGGYFAWDILTKAVMGDPNDKDGTFVRRLRSATLWNRGWTSALCLALAVLVYVTMRGFSKPRSVIATDAGLIALILLFRALKQGSWRWTGKAFALKTDGWSSSVKVSVWMFVVFLAAMVTAFRLQS